jgi:hypothetical protein
MFQRVCGFHIVFDKDQPHENVKKFSVKLLNLSRNNRHLDNQVHLALSLHYVPPCWPWARCCVLGVVSGKEGESQRNSREKESCMCLTFLPPCWRLRLLHHPPFLHLRTMLLLQVKTGFWDTLKASHRLASQMRDKAKLAAVRA